MNAPQRDHYARVVVTAKEYDFTLYVVKREYLVKCTRSNAKPRSKISTDCLECLCATQGVRSVDDLLSKYTNPDCYFAVGRYWAGCANYNILRGAARRI